MDKAPSTDCVFTGALYEIGSVMSFFAVKNYADEFITALDKGFEKTIAETEEDETVAATADEIIEATKVEGRKKSYIITDKGQELLKQEYERLKRQVEEGRSFFEVAYA